MADTDLTPTVRLCAVCATPLVGGSALRRYCEEHLPRTSKKGRRPCTTCSEPTWSKDALCRPCSGSGRSAGAGCPGCGYGTKSTPCTKCRWAVAGEEECASCEKHRKLIARGLCSGCYKRERAAGNLSRWVAKKRVAKRDQKPPLAGDDLIEHLKRKTVTTSAGCWEWRGASRNGYPQARVNGKTVRVHRAALEARLGAPLGVQQAHHRCANTLCINPDHIQAVTAAANNAEMMARRSYIDRIAELEQALRGFDPDHEALKRAATA